MQARSVSTDTTAMEELSKNLLEVLCRLSASKTHPVTLDALKYFLPELPEPEGAQANSDRLVEVLKCFPERFTVDDESELVYVNDEKAVVYFFLQEQFALAGKNRLSAQFLIESCIQRFSGNCLSMAAACLNESFTCDLIGERTVCLTSENIFNWLPYKAVVVSRFFEHLLMKLSCTKTSSWNLNILETYLYESPVTSHEIDLLGLFEHHSGVFEVKHSENGTVVSLKCDTEASSNAIAICHCKKYLSGKLAYSKDLAVPLEVLCTEAVSTTPREVQCRFGHDDKLATLRKLLEAHSPLFEMTEDANVYLTLCPLESQMDNLREALCYFYRLLYALSVYGHVCISYNVLISCLHAAPNSVRAFLDLEYPGLALADFFQSMTDFFDTSFKPNCVAPVLVCKPHSKFFEDVGINELEAVAVQQFVSLLWIVPQGLRIEVLELCLDNICDEVKEYCEERYSDGLSEFFLHHPGIFSLEVDTKVVRLSLSLPKFSSVRHTEEAVIAKCGTECQPYEDLTTLIEDVDAGTCLLNRFGLFGTLLGRSDNFKLQGGEVVLACNDLNLLLKKFEKRLDSLAKAFVETATSSRPELCGGAIDVEAESRSRDQPSKEPRAASDPLLADPSSGLSSEKCDETESSCHGDTESKGDQRISLNFSLIEDALKATPNEFQALFREHYSDGMAGFYGKYSYLFDHTEDGTVILSREYFPGGDIENLLRLPPRLIDGALCSNEGDKEQIHDTAVDKVQPNHTAVDSIPNLLKKCSLSSADYTMLSETQSTALRVMELVAELLTSSRDGERLDDLTQSLRQREPILLTFCEQHYHKGLLGFFKAHRSKFDILKVSKAGCTIRLHENAAGHSTDLVRLEGSIYHLYDSCGMAYCKEHEIVVNFPAWCFLSETVVSSLKSVLEKGCYVIFEALVNDNGKMTVLNIAKPEKELGLQVGKATFECRVVLAGFYYSLLVPLRICKSSGPTPKLKNVIVFSSDPNACLHVGQIVRAEVHFNYPSQKLWQALEFPEISVTKDKKTLPKKCASRGQSTGSSKPTPLQCPKGGLQKALVYFSRAVVNAGNNVPLSVLDKALDDAPKSVRDFCSQNFNSCMGSFVRKFSHAFSLRPDGKVRAFPQGINVPTKTKVAHLPKGNGTLQEANSQSSVAASGFSDGAAGKVSRKSPCSVIGVPGSSHLTETSVLRGLFGRVTGLWEAAIQVTSDDLPEPIEAPPSSFVHDSGMVSIVTTSEWHLGDVVEFDAIRRSSHTVPYLITCAFRVTDKSAREAVVPTACTCKVSLVTSYYVLMTMCGSRKSVIVVLSCPEKTSLALAQEVVVEVRPGYPSSHFWKADRLVHSRPK